jgi:hypothetical protein
VSQLLRVIFDPDTTPPTVPTITAVSAVGQDRLDVLWTVSIDTGSGLAGYQLLVDGVTTVSLGIQNSYSLTGLTAGSTHTFRVRALDGNGNLSNFSAQAQGTTTAAPPSYNPTFPRLGAIAISGSQFRYDLDVFINAAAKRHMVVLTRYLGMEGSRTRTPAQWTSEIKLRSTLGTKVFNYFIDESIRNDQSTPGNADYGLYQAAADNGWFGYNNGLTKSGPVDFLLGATSWRKFNYSVNSPTVGGKKFYQAAIDRATLLNRDGGTLSNGTTNVAVTANPNLDGLYGDNWFYLERNSADYDVDGSVDDINSSTSRLLIQTSRAAEAAYFRTLWPGSMLIVNAADWYRQKTILGLTIAGSPLDQLVEGGVIEAPLGKSFSAETTGKFYDAMDAIHVAMNAFRVPKLGMITCDIGSITNYRMMRYGLGMALLTDAYYYPHVNSFLPEELTNQWFDEFNFSLGAAIDPVQTAPRYVPEAGGTGGGVWRRDFVNGIVILGARRGAGNIATTGDQETAYASVALGGTFYRLTGTQDATTNNGATVTAIAIKPRDAVVLSRVPTNSQTINVSTAAQLLAAVNTANSVGGNRIISIADGTYTMTDVLAVNAPNITLRSQSANRANVIIRGPGATISSGNTLQFNVRVAATNFLAQDLTFGGYVNSSCVQVVGEGGGNNGILRNCILQDSFQHLMKGSTDGTSGASGWLVENCLFRFSAGLAPANYNGGIDAHRATNWIVRGTTFRDIASPSGSACQHAVNFWNGGTGNRIDYCLAIDCDRGFGSGLNSIVVPGNYQALANNNDLILNCMAVHTNNGDTFADVQFSVENSTNCRVVNCSAYLANSFTWAMEGRYTVTGSAFINCVANKQILARDGAVFTKTSCTENAQANWFVDVASNLALTSLATTLIDTGTDVATITTRDYKGTTRPQGSGWDRGADEYAPSSNPLTLPLATSSNLSITYLGSFTVPQEFEYGAGGMSIGGGGLYVGGLDTNLIFGRISIPAVGGAATTQVAPVSVSGTIGGSGSSAEDRRITGSLFYNNSLYIGETSFYDTDGAQNRWIKVANSSVGAQGTFCTASTARGSSTRMISGPMMHIPAIWQPILGGPAAVLGCHLSIVSTSQNGYGFGVFDPANVTSGGAAVAVDDLLGYSFSQPLEPGGPSYSGWASYPKNASGGTDYFSQVGQPLGTAFIPTGSRSLLYVTTHGYGLQDGGCRPGSSVNAGPYRCQISAFDLADLAAVKAGTMQRYQVRPTGFWVLPNSASIWDSCVGNFAGAGTFAFDPSTNRLYGQADGFHGGNLRIHVWQVGSLP